MKITNLKISKIKPNDWNTNRMSTDQFDRLMKRIEKVGFDDPITVLLKPEITGTEDFIIIDGYHRYKACKKLKFEEIPCVIANPESYKSKADIKLATLAKNRIHGEDDKIKLREEILTLSEEDNLEIYEICEETGLDFETTNFLVAEQWENFEQAENTRKEELQKNTLPTLKIILPTDLQNLRIDEDLKHDVIKFLRENYV